MKIIKITEECTKRLDQYLTDNTDYSRSKIQKMLKDKDILEELKKNTYTNKECSVHMHLGGYPVTPKSIFILHTLWHYVQDYVLHYIHIHNYFLIIFLFECLCHHILFSQRNFLILHIYLYFLRMILLVEQIRLLLMQ